jgi:hypothetical protein
MALVRELLADLTRFLARFGVGGRWRPASEWWIPAASLAGWIWLVAAGDARGFAGLCASGGPIGRLIGEWRAGILAGDVAGCLLMSLAMTLAMMLPLTIDAQRYVALRSFPWRRARALGGWLIGYLVPWLAVTWIVSLALMTLVGPAARPWVAAVGFLVAAAWQMTPAKAWALRACHRTRPLEPSGVRADASCLLFGARVGAACMASCGPMMLAAMASPWPTLARAGVFVVALRERYVWRPPIRATALALAAAGSFLALQAIAA